MFQNLNLYGLIAIVFLSGVILILMYILIKTRRFIRLNKEGITIGEAEMTHQTNWKVQKNKIILRHLLQLQKDQVE